MTVVSKVLLVIFQFVKYFANTTSGGRDQTGDIFDWGGDAEEEIIIC